MPFCGQDIETILVPEKAHQECIEDLHPFYQAYLNALMLKIQIEGKDYRWISQASEVDGYFPSGVIYFEYDGELPEIAQLDERGQSYVKDGYFVDENDNKIDIRAKRLEIDLRKVFGNYFYIGAGSHPETKTLRISWGFRTGWSDWATGLNPKLIDRVK